MRTRSRLITTILSALMLLPAGLLPTGCESTETVSSLGQARIDYDARRYEAAHQQAVLAVGESTGAERHDASYLAGLSAYKLGDMTEAESRFLAAIHSPDPHTAGSAKAMLGLIRLKQGRHHEAARLFKEAASVLSGNDARQAAQHAAVAYEAAGNVTAAETWMAIASEADLGGGVTTIAVPDDDAYTEFALQVGAFRDRWRARQAADDAELLARPRSLGPVRVIPQLDDRGRELFVVQIGRFATRQEATRVRQDLGRLEYIVTAAARETVATANPTLGL